MSLVIESDAVPLQEDSNGTIRVGNTRITLDLVIAAYLAGESAEGIAEMFDTLDLGDVYLVLGYYLHHADDVHEYLRERQENANEVRARIETQQDHAGLHERLMARLSGKQ